MLNKFLFITLDLWFCKKNSNISSWKCVINAINVIIQGDKYIFDFLKKEEEERSIPM